jgi:plasmid stabilization system protein ParE
MTATVVFSDNARDHAQRIDDWWRSNRSAAVSLFTEELAVAVDLLSASPRVGRRYRSKKMARVRRLHLPRTRFHVYYVYDRATTTVTIVAIWSALRERPPI